MRIADSLIRQWQKIVGEPSSPLIEAVLDEDYTKKKCECPHCSAVADSVIDETLCENCAAAGCPE